MTRIRTLPRSKLALATTVALLLGSCAIEDASSGKRRSSRQASHPQIAIIAMDGLEPSLLARLLKAGVLPNFQRLIDEGSIATIDPVTASISPVVWTTVATGVSPHRHGITDFTIDDVPVMSDMRSEPAYWNILPRYDVSSAVLGWMVTWPAEPHSGIIVSDRAHWGNFEDKIAPPDILDLERYHYTGFPDLTFLPRFTSYPYDPNFGSLPESDPRYAVNYLLRRRLIEIHVHDSTFSRMAAQILAENTLDLVAVYFQGADYVSHGFWQYFDPEPFRAAGWTVPEEDAQQLGDIIPKYYVYLDRLVGDLLERLEDDALVIALSDHGFGPGLGEYEVHGTFLSGNHRPEGVLILSGPQVVDGLQQTERITHLDILPTLLFSLGVPIARDLEGHPLLSYFEDSFLGDRPVAFVPSYSFGKDRQEASTGSEQDEEILDELRSLGYID